MSFTTRCFVRCLFASCDRIARSPRVRQYVTTPTPDAFSRRTRALVADGKAAASQGAAAQVCEGLVRLRRAILHTRSGASMLSRATTVASDMLLADVSRRESVSRCVADPGALRSLSHFARVAAVQRRATRRKSVWRAERVWRAAVRTAPDCGHAIAIDLVLDASQSHARCLRSGSRACAIRISRAAVTERFVRSSSRDMREDRIRQ